MQIESITHQTAEELAQLQLAFLDKNELEENAAVRGWLLLDDVDPETDFEAAFRPRHSLTGQWFLDSDTFGDWLSSKKCFLLGLWNSHVFMPLPKASTNNFDSWMWENNFVVRFCVQYCSEAII